MSWKETDRVNERREFIMLATQPDTNFSALCRRFGVSRKTGYKWLARHRDGGDEALADQCRAPHSSPVQTVASVEETVPQIRDAHPAWGGRKIRARMIALKEKTIPSASTITAILRRNDRIRPEDSQKSRPFGSFERPEPNDLWQMDFKGEFRMGNRKYCYPLTVLDDHSRYSIGLVACDGQTFATVQTHLTGIFRRYGLPRAFYVDNGNPWGVSHSPGGHTRLTAWLMRLDVKTIHGRPYHPQGRGKDERFHRTLNAECLQQRHIVDLPDAQKRFDPFRSMYNHERPHESLDNDVPASRYRMSDRSFPETLSGFEYSSRFEVRRTNKVGQFRFRGRVFKTSEAFQKDAIGLAPTTQDGVWEVYYRHFPIGLIDFNDERSRLIHPKHKPSE